METYLNDLMNVQHRQGLNVSALVHSSAKQLKDTSQLVDNLGGDTYSVTHAARWLNIGYVPISPLFLFAAHKKIGRDQPDVIHIHLPNASALWLLFSSRARKIPWLIHWHADIVTPSSNSIFKLFYQVFRFFERRLLKRAKKIVVTSEAYLSDSAPLRAFLGKCDVVPLGLDTKRLPSFDAVLPRNTKNKQRYQLLFIGRLSAYKGVGCLVSALQELHDAHLWIAGDGEERVKIFAQVDELQLSDRVTMLGEIDDQEKWSLIKAADALVLPSINKNEAFGIVLMEAGFYGLPLVATRIKGSGVSWVASQFNAHALAKPEAPHELAISIRSVLEANGDQPRNTSGSSAFDLESLCEQILYHYREGKS